MKLFFETAQQAGGFLVMVPVGLFLAMLTDLTGNCRKSRPLCDVFVMLIGCAILGWLLIVTGDERIRLYHLLAVLTGAVLYMTGLRRIFRCLSAKAMKMKKKLQPDPEGKKKQSVE